MPDDNLNEKANDKDFQDSELIRDVASSPLEKVDENSGPKRRKKESKNNEDKTEEVVEEIVEKVEEVIEEIEEVFEEATIEETEEVKEEAVIESKPVIAKEVKKSVNVEFSKKEKASDKEETKTVAQNNIASLPKTTKERYTEMLAGKNFEIRMKGNRIYDNKSKLAFEITEEGIKINNKNYKFSDVVIRIKK